MHGQWEPILTEDEYDIRGGRVGAIPRGGAESRLGAKGRGYRTIYLLSPFVRCGNCSARMIGSRRRNRRGELEEFYRCPAKGNGGCGTRDEDCRAGQRVHQGTGDRGG